MRAKCRHGIATDHAEVSPVSKPSLKSRGVATCSAAEPVPLPLIESTPVTRLLRSGKKELTLLPWVRFTFIFPWPVALESI